MGHFHSHYQTREMLPNIIYVACIDTYQYSILMLHNCRWYLLDSLLVDLLGGLFVMRLAENG